MSVARKSISTSIHLVLAAFLLPAAASGQTYHLDTAVLPLPHELRTEATIVKRTGEGSFETLRDGKNGYFCIADEPGDERFSAACHPIGLMKYIVRRDVLTASMEAVERDRLIADEIREGRLSLPAGAISRFISGATDPSTGAPESVMMWDEIAVPFANAEQTGLTTANAGEAPWLMRAGEYGAHIMIDYRRVAWNQLVVSQPMR